MGITDSTVQSGMALHGVKLFSLEVAVYITRVDDISHWTGEVVGEKLGLCIRLIIRWNWSQIRYVDANATIPNAEVNFGLRRHLHREWFRNLSTLTAFKFWGTQEDHVEVVKL